MQVFRIENQSRATDALSGEGARIYGGRWNSIGEHAVYTSMHRSLAMLEIIAHIFDSRHFPVNRVMVSIDIPEEYVHFIPFKDLPSGWDDAASYKQSEEVFHEYCLSNDRLAIAVPSVVVPQEYNVVINPLHIAMKHVSVTAVETLSWDARLARAMNS